MSASDKEPIERALAELDLGAAGGEHGSSMEADSPPEPVRADGGGIFIMPPVCTALPAPSLPGPAQHGKNFFELPDCSEMWCDSPTHAEEGQIVLCPQSESNDLGLSLQELSDLGAIVDTQPLPPGRHHIVQVARATKDALPKAKAKGKNKGKDKAMAKAMVVQPTAKRAAWGSKAVKNKNDVYSAAYRAMYRRCGRESLSEPEARQRAQEAGRAAVQAQFGMVPCA